MARKLRFGDVMTASGKVVNIMDSDIPRESIDIVDISKALSLQCRFAGHTHHMYSVAQHCIVAVKAAYAIGKEAFAPQTLLAILMHDAHEAYMGDVMTPVKAQSPDIQALDKRLQNVVFSAFNITDYDRDAVKLIDMRMFQTECDVLMPRHKIDTGYAPLDYPDIMQAIAMQCEAAYIAEQFRLMWTRLNTIVALKEFTACNTRRQ